MMRTRTPYTPNIIERIVGSVGSVGSLAIHTVAFASFFLLAVFGILSWELMLLVLTTILSLEAIYLAIFIQITVNKHTQSLREVEEDIDEIQEDVEELNEDDDDEPVAKKSGKKQSKEEALEQLTKDVARMLADLEALKGGK